MYAEPPYVRHDVHMQSVDLLPAHLIPPFDHTWALVRQGQVVAQAGNVNHVYPLASVTKLIATWACLIAVDRGMCHLDDEVGPQGATMRHLLSHASGLPFDSTTAQLEPLKRRIYSNAGIEKACEHVEACAGVDTSRWIDLNIFDPLGMSQSRVDGSPAHSGMSNITDLTLFACELGDSQLLSTDLFREATSIQFPELAGIVPGYGRHTPCPWGLGVEIRGQKTPHWMPLNASENSYGHFGVSGSFMWIDPDHQVAAVFLGAEPFGAWHKEHWSQMNTVLLSYASAL
ncbi:MULTISPECIES: serine hydrolase domain-containing protein [unclassified Schaalia]|uniref:serine hydrolase domain-containing protein n=1 Tax=unclassified Schaalia TaxID=2691889 RepID=UPI001E3984FF|nr:MULTISPECIES: serine hydrolase domain-containing protein [unclassified Schaalia]MCD4549942.1 beta-lactamase family protein [Schaalia sp. lx-260]MCD4557700.1 beta-lactamase family protein [Schaalia sp. lx-100]